MFLNEMVTTPKQREGHQLLVEQRQAALAKIYEELKTCRYLRLPSKGDADRQEDSLVPRVFGKK